MLANIVGHKHDSYAMSLVLILVLPEPMMDKLLAMRLHGMADALKTQQQDPSG